MPIQKHVSSHPSKKEAIMYAIVEIAGHQYKVQQDNGSM